MFKKILSGILALAMVSATAVLPVTAEGETEETTHQNYVVYENNFDDETSWTFETPITGSVSDSVITSENNADGWVFSNKNGWKLVTEENGNKWFATYGTVDNTESYRTRRMVYNFKDTVDSGKIYISYDFKMDGVAGDEYYYNGDADCISLCERTVESKDEATGVETYSYLTKRALTYMDPVNAKLYANSSFSTVNGNYFVDKTIESDTVYEVDVIFDIDNKMSYVAVDGEVYKSGPYTGGKETFNQISFLTHTGVNYDNLKIAYMADDSFKAEIADITSRSFDVDFSEAVDVATLKPENVTVLTADGAKVPVESVTQDGVNGMKVELADKMAGNANYTVSLAGIKNIAGNAITDTLSFTSPEAESYLIYETDFETESSSIFDKTFYVDGAFSKVITSENNADAWVFTNKNGYRFVTDENGNRWFGVNENTDSVNTSLQRGLSYNFKNPISDGKLYISYDFYVDLVGTETETNADGTVINGVDTGTIANNTSNKITFDKRVVSATDETTGVETYGFEFLRALVFEESINSKLCARNDFSSRSNAGYFVDKTIESKKTYEVDIVCDFTNKKGYMSVDGEVFETGCSIGEDAVAQISFTLRSGYFMDNLKIAYMADDSFEATISNIAPNSFDIEFSEAVDANTLKAENFEVKAADGTLIPVSSVIKNNANSATVNLASQTANNTKYTVTVSENLKNIIGNSLADNTLNFTSEDVVYFEDFNSVADSTVSYTGGTRADYKDADGTTAVEWKNSGSKNYFLATTFDNPVYANGQVSLEYRVSADVNTLKFIPYLTGSNGTKARMLYVIDDTGKIQYVNNLEKEKAAGTAFSVVTGTGFHTYKINLDFDNKTADLYMDGVKLNDTPYHFSNFNNVAYAAGSLNGIRIDYTPNGGDATAYIDYIKVTKSGAAEPENGLYVREFKMTKDGEEVDVSTLAANDTVTVSVNAINASGEAKSVYLLGGVYNDGQYSVGNVTEITDVADGSVISGTVDVTVADLTKLSLKGFLWEMSDLSPLCDALVK